MIRPISTTNAMAPAQDHTEVASSHTSTRDMITTTATMSNTMSGLRKRPIFFDIFSSWAKLAGTGRPPWLSASSSQR